MKQIEETLGEIGRNISSVRMKAGFTQEELAIRAEIPLALLLEMENGSGDYPIDVLFRLAKLLNCSVCVFFMNT